MGKKLNPINKITKRIYNRRNNKTNRKKSF